MSAFTDGVDHDSTQFHRSNACAPSDRPSDSSHLDHEVLRGVGVSEGRV